MSHPFPAQAKHILDGQWKLGKCIGQGSFGSVYTCMDEATGVLMAVKMMAIPTSSAPGGASAPPQPRDGRPNKPESELRALCSEIEIMRSFEHPNIVRYLGAAVDEPNLQLYIFQEWVPGGSLASLSAHYGALSEPVVRRYTIHMLRGLEYLHAANIIHRDIKCGNVLVDDRAAKESEIPNFKGSDLGRFPLVLADFWTSDHLSERSRSVDAFSGTRARGTLTLKRR
jgi:serine/threonine protein kinase